MYSHLLLDEAQQMLLIHARRSMNVCVNLPFTHTHTPRRLDILTATIAVNQLIVYTVHIIRLPYASVFSPVVQSIRLQTEDVFVHTGLLVRGAFENIRLKVTLQTDLLTYFTY